MIVEGFSVISQWDCTCSAHVLETVFQAVKEKDAEYLEQLKEDEDVYQAQSRLIDACRSRDAQYFQVNGEGGSGQKKAQHPASIQNPWFRSAPWIFGPKEPQQSWFANA